MRISDWSSDVCSSDLRPSLFQLRHRARRISSTQSLQFARPFYQAFDSVRLKVLPSVDWLTESYRSAAGSTKRIGDGFTLKMFWMLTVKPSPPRRRSEERRVGNECVRTVRYRWSPHH